MIVWATLAASIVGLVASLGLTPLVTRLAARQGWLDQPDGRRKLHATPVPRVGGLAVYASFALTFGMLVLFVPHAISDGPGIAQGYVHLLLACGAVVSIGLIDDLARVRPLAKVLVQTMAALYLYFHGYQIRLVSNPFGEPFSLGPLALPLTVVWFVGMSNAFNLIDGFDGLAAGVAFFATVSLLVAAALNGHWATALMASSLAGSLLGFMRYNFSPATIFLGDCGSLFVGFALASFALSGSLKTSTAIAVTAPLLALALPIFDVLVSILRRLIRGTGLFEADRNHIHHRLARRGLTPRRVVVILYGVAAVLATLSLAIAFGPKQVLWAVIFVVALLTWVGLSRLGYTELGELQRLLLQRLVPDRRTVANNVHLLDLREALASSQSFAEAWDELIEAASRLDCRGVVIKLRPDFDRQLAHVFEKTPPRHSFPSWIGRDADAEALWSWTIPLPGVDGPLGTLVLDFDGQQKQLGFEPSHLLEAVTKEFATVTLRCLSTTARREQWVQQTATDLGP